MSLPSSNLSLDEHEQELVKHDDFAKTYEVYRKRTGASHAMARMVIEMYLMQEPYSELEPISLLKRIRALEGR